MASGWKNPRSPFWYTGFIDARGGERATLSLEAITPKDIREFRDALAAGGRAASTVNIAVKKTLNVPFATALRLDVNPVASVESLKVSRHSGRDVFTIEQVRSLVKATSGGWHS